MASYPREGSETAVNTQRASFRAPWWLRNRHAQTLWPAVVRQRPAVALRQERFEIDDGDFLDLFWGPPRRGHLVVVLHGLGGCARSFYMLGLLRRLAESGYQGVVMQYRGAAATPNRLDRFYHAGAWEDPARVVTRLRARFPQRRIAVVGFSLGGSILLNWLGIRGSEAPVDAGIGVSTPFDLARCAEAMNRGFARVYQANLMRWLKAMYRAKFAYNDTAPISVSTLERLRTLREFDHYVTAPLHGFDGVDHYYQRCSCRQRLGGIRRPTLILQAHDDPFVPAANIVEPAALPAELEIEISPRGGHVGFVGGAPWQPRYWLETRIVNALDDML